MATQTDPGLVAEIHCLNCARVLAQAVRRSHGAAVEIRPSDHGSIVEVEVVDSRSLRCRRCGGSAYVDVFRSPVERRGALRSWPVSA